MLRLPPVDILIVCTGYTVHCMFMYMNTHATYNVDIYIGGKLHVTYRVHMYVHVHCILVQGSLACLPPS